MAALAVAPLGHDPVYDHGDEIISSTPSSPADVQVDGEMGGNLTIDLDRAGDVCQLDLSLYNCQSENFRVLESRTGGVLAEIPAPPVCTYRGTVTGDLGSEVIGVVTDEGCRLRITCSDGECFQIEPQGVGHVWRPVAAIELHDEIEHAARFLADPKALTQALALPRMVTVKQAEIGFDIDFPTWARGDRGGFAGNDATAIAKMEEFVAVKLNNFVISNALVEHVVGTIVIRKSSAEDPYDGMTNSGQILRKVRDVWNGTGNTGFPRPSTTHHLATGLIGRGIGVAGLGYVGTINEGSRYTIGSTVSGSGVGFWFNGVAKHEVAHNWGLVHGGCGDERRPGGDFFTWSMCGGFHDRMRSDEASRAISERNSSNLPDIGPYTASNQGPYCPRDDYSLKIGSGDSLLDVQRNDYDANNTPFQIESFLVNNATTTNLGATISISEGSGPGGRDQLLYSAPATGAPGQKDVFYYIVRDETGKGSFGQVTVELIPDGKSKPLAPGTFIADTAEDFSGETNPNGQWAYGYFNRGETNLNLTSAQQTDTPVKVGSENEGWIAEGGSRIHKQSQIPGDSVDSAKRWVSDYTGDVTIEYNAMRLDGATGNGCRPFILHNGTQIWAQTLTGNRAQTAGRVHLTIKEGDLIDFAIDSLGDRASDWTFYTSRIIAGHLAKFKETDEPALHFPMDAAGSYPVERRAVIADVSPSGRHSVITDGDNDENRLPTEIANGLSFDGINDRVGVDSPSSLQGATQITISAWINPTTIDQNDGIITTLNFDNQGLSYFGILAGGDADGKPIQFRAHSAALNAGFSYPLGEWTHVVGVWEAGLTFKLYVNGVEVASSAAPSSATFDTDQWIFGRDRTQANRFFDGSLDDVAIWGRALPAGEVIALYQQGRYSESFNGTTDFVQESSRIRAQGASEVTMGAWVRARSLGDNRGIITSYNSDDQNRSYFGFLIGSTADGRPAQFRAHRDLVNALPGSFPVNEWVHITGVWRAGVEQTLYVDGTPVATSTDPSAEPIDIDSWIIGRDRLIANRFFDGDIADSFIMPRAMGSDEVLEVARRGRTNFNAQSGVFEFTGGIGAIPRIGSFREASGIYTTTTRGGQISGAADSFYMSSRKHRGDGELTVRLDGLNDTGSGAKLGVMMRDSREAGSPFVLFSQYGDGRLLLRSRAVEGGGHTTHLQETRPLTFPLWVRLTRDGDNFTASYSEDGEGYQFFDRVNVDLEDLTEMGVAHQTGNGGLFSVASFGDFSLESQFIPLIDSDDDGLNDDWERDNFGDLAQGSAGDPDMDGITNIFERFHGTDPNESDSGQFSPSVARFGSDFTSTGSLWRFLDDGSDQGTDWRMSDFDDSSWSNGASPLGYPLEDVTTEVSFGDNFFTKHLTTYFRRDFFIADPTALTNLQLSVMRDDGFVLYLNGNQLASNNLTAPVDYLTRANSSLTDAQRSTPVVIPIDASDLVAGQNTFAVEVHQVSPGNSDLFFDLAFQADVPVDFPSGEFLGMSFERSKAVADEFLMVLEGSDDLVGWDPINVPLVVIEDRGETELVQAVDDQLVGSEPRRFLRIRLEPLTPQVGN